MSQLAGKTIFLTGATGFIGKRVLAALSRRGANVRAGSRSAAGKSWLKQQGVAPVDVNFRDSQNLRRAMAGCEGVIHLAYDIRASGADNLSVFRTLLDAARAEDIPGMVHASSVVVYDGWPSSDISETSPITLSGSGYRRAKIEMENIAMAQDLPVAIVQPTLVYGPGSSLWTTRFAKALMQGGVVMPEASGTAHLVYVDDVANAIVAAAARLPQASGRYLISGDGKAGWSEYLGGLATLLKAPQPQVLDIDTLISRAGPRPDPNSPPRPPSLSARISGVGRRLIGHDRFEQLTGLAAGLSGRKASPLYPDHVLLDLFRCTSRLEIARANKDLNYAPAFDLQAGLDETASFLRSLREKG